MRNRVKYFGGFSWVNEHSPGLLSHRFLIIVLLFGLYSCKDRRLQYYGQLVDRADKIVIAGPGGKDSVVINSSPVLEKMKNMLKRNIEPKSPEKFQAD